MTHLMRNLPKYSAISHGMIDEGIGRYEKQNKQSEGTESLSFDLGRNKGVGSLCFMTGGTASLSSIPMGKYCNPCQKLP
jgi:hypothetical protein